MGIMSLLADVVFVGHSLVGPTLPGLVESALKQLGAPSVVQAQIINGASLAYNWDNSAEAEGIDKIVEAFGAEWRFAGCSMCTGCDQFLTRPKLNAPAMVLPR